MAENSSLALGHTLSRIDNTPFVPNNYSSFARTVPRTCFSVPLSSGRFGGTGIFPISLFPPLPLNRTQRGSILPGYQGHVLMHDSSWNYVSCGRYWLCPSWKKSKHTSDDSQADLTNLFPSKSHKQTSAVANVWPASRASLWKNSFVVR